MKSEDYGKAARKALGDTEEKKTAGKAGDGEAKKGGRGKGEKVIAHIMHTPHQDGSHHMIHKHHPPHHEAKHDEHHDLPDLDAVHDHLEQHLGGMNPGEAEAAGMGGEGGGAGGEGAGEDGGAGEE